MRTELSMMLGKRKNAQSIQGFFKVKESKDHQALGILPAGCQMGKMKKRGKLKLDMKQL